MCKKLCNKNTQPNADTVRYDRPLTVEVWYPAMAATGSGGTQYTTETRNLAVIATLHGSAVRDAESLREGEDFPLVICPMATRAIAF